MIEINYRRICQKILEDFPSRYREVLWRRFGLQGKKQETLQKIGQSFGVTRERIRQIEKEALERLKRKSEERILKKIFFLFENYLKEKGGIKREDILLIDLGKNSFQNEVYFLLHLNESFYRFPETEKVYPFWAIERFLFEKVSEILERLINFFKKEKKLLSEEDLFKLAKKENSYFLTSIIEVAKSIEKGPLGDFGLVHWPEVKPRGVRDKAYLALKKVGHPLHFKEIAQYSQKLENFSSSFSRKILPQTVHNELIKDERFVLVGRGIYALKEWGYQPGTVREIITIILEKAKTPLSSQEIIAKVKEQRLVKDNTILLNLQNRAYFSRDNQGKYFLKREKLEL